MSEKTVVQSNGSGVLGLLGVVFVTLKLCGVIDWSWWWVTAPFWGGLALLILVFVGALAVVSISVWRDERNRRKRFSQKR